mgnify:CR=1 FL=1
MSLNFSWLSTGMPLLTFVFVFILIYAILKKTKILGETGIINVITSLILSIILLAFTSVGNYIANITPWFSVLLTISFFFFMLIAFLIKEPASFLKPLTIVFIIIFAFVLIAAIFYTFPNTQAYLPGQSEEGANDTLLTIKHFIFEEKFLSGFLLLVIAIIVGFIITR